MAERAKRNGDVEVSLSDDGYEYNNRVFTLEVVLYEGHESVDNDGAVSGVKVDASAEAIDAYLGVALEIATRHAAEAKGVRNVAARAANAAMDVVRGRADLSGALDGDDGEAEGDVLSHNTVVENIAEVLRGAGGSWVAQIYNQVCSDRVQYLGDSVFKRL